MKITRIRIFKTALPYIDGVYVWGAGNAIETAIAAIVVIDTSSPTESSPKTFTPCPTMRWCLRVLTGMA
mgnify:CR=1 FL=1